MMALVIGRVFGRSVAKFPTISGSGALIGIEAKMDFAAYKDLPGTGDNNTVSIQHETQPKNHYCLKHLFHV
jgi:hypothetical protein